MISLWEASVISQGGRRKGMENYATQPRLYKPEPFPLIMNSLQIP